jgi:quercetin dioxygenase-like cupin family protein
MSVRRSTPRPTFEHLAVLRAGEAVTHLWGDEISGYVGDDVLISSSKIHGLVFTLPPGGRFTHSERNRTIFGADEVYYVLRGTLLLANPATGELRRAAAGEAVFFRRDTWHHGINQGTDQLQVLEIFAPPPAAGMASVYAQQQPYLDQISYSADGFIGNWPMDREKVRSAATLHHISRADRHLRLEGSMLVEVLVSTAELTVTYGELLPGQSSDYRSHGGDAFAVVTDGAVNLHTPDEPERNWWTVRTGDTAVLPEGTKYRCVNQGDVPARFLLAAAPTYLAETA